MWAYNSVFYQIYPIGFTGAPTSNDGKVVPRILKLKEWTEYLENLGISSILLNPIFESDNHGYDTRDFRKIDCRLGTNEDFAEVCQDLHDHNIKIVLDGVFNHVGRGFWAFRDVQEKKWDSPYKDWFHLNFDGNSCYNDGFWYEGWEGHYELVKLNLQNPAVVDYLLDCVKFWIDTFDIDGLRLDVAYCLDHNFMRRLRTFSQEIKPDFALIGEVLFGDYNLIVNDEMLHSCTNYECYKGLFSSFNSMNMFEIAHSLHRQFGSDQWCIYRGKHLMTFADNHDVTRLASILTNKAHIPLAYGLLLGMPGVPCIYYGSEWGAEGQKAPDNDYALRPCFEKPEPNELTSFIKDLIRVRQSSDGLCNGSYRNVVLTNHQLIFERASENEKVFVAINASGDAFTASHGDLNGSVTDLLTNEEMQLNGQLDMPPYSVKYLKFC
ncbi:alpha-amylase family glycosyl hydrolase [Sporofaciens sp. SGI.106]|uniref:alpha-amylase family glycosyl hydrolase n=1 Tax=Sporofaciens sp. SGI.106 TaxID=3420568 RepID=UPI003D038DDB